jgi:hypothetical protein
VKRYHALREHGGAFQLKRTWEFQKEVFDKLNKIETEQSRLQDSISMPELPGMISMPTPLEEAVEWLRTSRYAVVLKRYSATDVPLALDTSAAAGRACSSAESFESIFPFASFKGFGEEDYVRKLELLDEDGTLTRVADLLENIELPQDMVEDPQPLIEVFMNAREQLQAEAQLEKERQEKENKLEMERQERKASKAAAAAVETAAKASQKDAEVPANPVEAAAAWLRDEKNYDIAKVALVIRELRRMRRTVDSEELLMEEDFLDRLKSLDEDGELDHLSDRILLESNADPTEDEYEHLKQLLQAPGFTFPAEPDASRFDETALEALELLGAPSRGRVWH